MPSDFRHKGNCPYLQFRDAVCTCDRAEVAVLYLRNPAKEVDLPKIKDYTESLRVLCRARDEAMKAAACLTQSVVAAEPERLELVLRAKELMDKSLIESTRLVDYHRGKLSPEGPDQPPVRFK